ncbi:hypothetical protein [Paenibacillus polymyxa]|uniref:hypothetical protein n=1 Tax=Paenibacillus polymyxa TaxID=1406 RepID=UPI00129A1BDD|nr:hypothetical protein [Paenibacillus polymyxa]KAE8558959.1 hypothetical protein BJH92_16880 [Paenibacillus polymyxa]
MKLETVDDILRLYGKGGDNQEVKKDDGSQGVSGAGKDRKGKREADTHIVEGVSKEHGNSL